MEELKYGPTTTYLLIILNSLVFILATFLNGLHINQYAALLLGGGYWSGVVQGELWRLITSNYLHIELFHFVLNMIGLYYYGKFLERFYLGRELFIIYTITGITGTLASIFLSPDAITLGASTAIFGFIGVMIGDSIRSNTYSPGLPIDIRQMLPSIITWIAVGFIIPGISGAGHLGGLIGGILCGLYFDTENTFRPSNIEEKSIPILYYGSVFATILSFILMFVAWL